MKRSHPTRRSLWALDTGDMLYLGRLATPFVGVALVAAAVFAWLSDAVGDHDGITAFDAPAAAWIATHRTLAEGQAGLVVANATGPAALLALTVLLSALLWWRGASRQALILASGVAISYVAGGLAKLAEHRPRPTAPINLTPEVEPSFPSGHVLVVSTLLGLLILLAWTRLSRAVRVAAVSTAVVAIAAVAVDRLVVGAHWITDVVGAITLSLVIVSAAAAACRVAEAREGPAPVAAGATLSVGGCGERGKRGWGQSP